MVCINLMEFENNKQTKPFRCNIDCKRMFCIYILYLYINDDMITTDGAGVIFVYVSLELQQKKVSCQNTFSFERFDSFVI